MDSDKICRHLGARGVKQAEARPDGVIGRVFLQLAEALLYGVQPVKIIRRRHHVGRCVGAGHGEPGIAHPHRAVADPAAKVKDLGAFGKPCQKTVQPAVAADLRHQIAIFVDVRGIGRHCVPVDHLWLSIKPCRPAYPGAVPAAKPETVPTGFCKELADGVHPQSQRNPDQSR